MLFNIIHIVTCVTVNFENLKLSWWCRTHQGQIVLYDLYRIVDIYTATSTALFSLAFYFWKSNNITFLFLTGHVKIQHVLHNE